LEQIIVGRSGLLDHLDPYRSGKTERLLDRLARQRRVEQLRTGLAGRPRWTGRAARRFGTGHRSRENDLALVSLCRGDCTTEARAVRSGLRAIARPIAMRAQSAFTTMICCEQAHTPLPLRTVVPARLPPPGCRNSAERWKMAVPRNQGVSERTTCITSTTFSSASISVNPAKSAATTRVPPRCRSTRRTGSRHCGGVSPGGVRELKAIGRFDHHSLST